MSALGTLPVSQPSEGISPIPHAAPAQVDRSSECATARMLSRGHPNPCIRLPPSSATTAVDQSDRDGARCRRYRVVKPKRWCPSVPPASHRALQLETQHAPRKLLLRCIATCLITSAGTRGRAGRALGARLCARRVPQFKPRGVSLRPFRVGERQCRGVGSRPGFKSCHARSGAAAPCSMAVLPPALAAPNGPRRVGSLCARSRLPKQPAQCAPPRRR
jgi:hypothetical protein